MNPIGVLCVAISSGCGAGLVVGLRGLVVGRDAFAPTAPVDGDVNELDAAPERDTWDGDGEPLLATFGEELAGIREKRNRVRAARADTLRGIYLASLEIEAKAPGEVRA